jgi:hypothetical protein
VTQFSLVKFHSYFGGTYCFLLQRWRVGELINQKQLRSKQSSETACLSYFLTLKMNKICSSETSVNFNWTKLDHSWKTVIFVYVTCHLIKVTPRQVGQLKSPLLLYYKQVYSYINSTQPSLSWEAARPSATQEFPNISWKPNVHCRARSSLPTVPYPELEESSPCHPILCL